jgi:hypothetical protein
MVAGLFLLAVIKGSVAPMDTSLQAKEQQKLETHPMLRSWVDYIF